MKALNRVGATAVILTLLGSAFLLVGCTAAPPLSDFERSLYTDGPLKASVVIYRSTGESWIHKPIPARIHIDGSHFARLLGGEYVQIYLSSGQHEIKVEYYRDCELEIPAAERAVVLEQERPLYLEIVPGFRGMTWVFCSPFQLVPVPMVGSAVELYLKEKESALEYMGRPLDEELLEMRRITR